MNTKKDTRKRKGKGAAALWAIGAVVGLALMIGAGLGLRYLLAGPTGAVEQREIVLGGQYRVQRYDEFFDLRGDIDAKRLRLSVYAASGDLNGREQTQCRGLLASTTELIADYNAAAAAYRTRGQWRDPSLPQQITQVTAEEASACA